MSEAGGLTNGGSLHRTLVQTMRWSLMGLDEAPHLGQLFIAGL
jgi:hypothetical protein